MENNAGDREESEQHECSYIKEVTAMYPPNMHKRK
jgi:hypothetical protein